MDDPNDLDTVWASGSASLLLFSLLVLSSTTYPIWRSSRIPNRCGNDAALIIYVRKVQGAFSFAFLAFPLLSEVTGPHQ